MKCGDTCRHNISKLNSGLSVKLLQLPLQRSGEALEENLEGACSIFLQKSFILVRHIYWIFRLLRGGWLGCTRAFVKWHLSPYPLKFSLWSTATTHPHCHCTPRHPRARALARLVSSSQGMARFAWHGMVWLGVRARCLRAFVKWHLSPYPLKFSLWSTATTHPHCHCTPRHPRARALARLVSSSQGMAGLAWHGMVWLGVRARCFHNEVW